MHLGDTFGHCLAYRAADKALTEKEVNDTHNLVRKKLVAELSAQCGSRSAHFFLKAAISAFTFSAEWVRPARIESIPALILPRTSFLQTSLMQEGWPRAAAGQS
jgi:hypothetical protein